MFDTDIAKLFDVAIEKLESIEARLSSIERNTKKILSLEKRLEKIENKGRN